jgi:phage baseplate assembly protein W
MSFTAQLPLNKTRNGTYTNIDNQVEFIKQNVKNLLLTNPGERIMIPEFGVGLRRFLFENANSDVKPAVKERIQSQFDNYLPTVELIDVKVEIQDNSMLVKVFYNLINFNIQDFIQLAVTN